MSGAFSYTSSSSFYSSIAAKLSIPLVYIIVDILVEAAFFLALLALINIFSRLFMSYSFSLALLSANQTKGTGDGLFSSIIPRI